MKKCSKILFAATILLCLTSVAVCAETARDITDSVIISSNEISIGSLCDDTLSTHSSGKNVSISIYSTEDMGGIYIKYYKIPDGGILNDTFPIAQNKFLHEFIELDGERQASLYFQNVDISDIYIYSVGDIPKDVQLWQIGDMPADILLCATHSDDDQLFFAGLLPLYAGHTDANVQVAYFINHYDTYNRTHELLDGLWHCGVKNYPVISPFPDGYSESVDAAVNYLSSKGISYSDILSFQKSLLEKYKPLVVVLHDFNGEYGHGAHMLNTKSFIEVCENAGDDDFIPEKIYVHLYDKSIISLDIDTPLDEFSGLSAFNVSQEAFGFHKSQHWTWFYDWIYGKGARVTNSSQIRTYNPASYGLYYTRVGEDLHKNDILENVTLYFERNMSEESETDILIAADEIAESDENSTVDVKIEKTNNNQKYASAFPFYFLPAVILIITALCASIIFKSNKKQR